MPVTPTKPGPYAPATAILGVIDRYRNRGLQTPFNREVLGRAGVSDSLIPRTLQALQTLDLINTDGTPTETLEGLRKASATDYKNRLQEWIKAAYAEVLSFVDPSTDSQDAIRDAFRNYEPVGQQMRMVSVFMVLCEEAGLKTVSRKEATPGASASAKSSMPTRRYTPREKTSPPSKIPSALAGLLGSLPPEGTGWTQTQRDKFLSTFSTVLDYCFPVRKGNDEESK